MAYSITVQGQRHKWSLTLADEYLPETIHDMQQDGLDIGEVVETYPVSVEELEQIKQSLKNPGPKQ